jgi:hypothetical protein
MNQITMNQKFAAAQKKHPTRLPKGVTITRVLGGAVGKLYPFERSLGLELSDEDANDAVEEWAREVQALESMAIEVFVSVLENREKETASLVAALIEQRADRTALELAEASAKRAVQAKSRACKLELVSRPPILIQRYMGEDKVTVWRCNGRIGVRVQVNQ